MNGFTTASAIGAITAFVLTAGGGTAMVAEASLPGDALYGVKRSFNEPIRESLAFSTSAQADVEAELSLRRLKEIETLASQSRLDEETRTQLSAEFVAHAQAANALAVDAADSGEAEQASEVMADFSTKLVEHETLMRSESDMEGGPWLDMDSTIGVLAAVRADTLSAQANVEAHAESDMHMEMDDDHIEREDDDYEDDDSSDDMPADSNDDDGLSVEAGMIQRAELHL